MSMRFTFFLQNISNINGLRRKTELSPASPTATRPRINLNQLDRFRRKAAVVDSDEQRRQTE
jgi:hypothetical protein